MIRVRDASVADLEQIVSAHARAFPGYFLTRLGPRFLSLMYRGFIDARDGIMLVAEDDGRIDGFVAGTTSPASFFRGLLRHSLLFLVASSSALAREPMLVTRRLMGAIAFRGEAPPALNDAALLSSIGVPPEASGRGTGRTLLEQFCARARLAGCRHVYLTTDRDGNPAVSRFYESFGFTLESMFRRPQNRWMKRYVLRLEDRGGTGQ